MKHDTAGLNRALYNALNDLDDRRERRIKASSTGRHEPSSAYGLWDVEDVDDGGRLIERRELGTRDRFIPVDELPAHLLASSAPDAEPFEIESVETVSDAESDPDLDGLQIEEVRYLVGRTQTSVILRRRTTLHAV